MSEKFNLEEKEPIFVDLFSQEIEDKIKTDGNLYLRKIEPIKGSRQLNKNETVKTKLSDGTTESEVDAKSGDWVVTGSMGEEFHLTDEKFKALYEGDGEGNFIPRKRKIIAIKNPFGERISITAPWSTPQKQEFQSGNGNCMIVISLDDSGNFTNGRYIIGDEQMLLNNYNLIEG